MKPPASYGIDGHSRAFSDEKEISHNVTQVFKTPTGKEVLKYLRSITIEMVSGPNIRGDELMHLEGQRYIVGLIERRVQHSAKIKQEAQK